MTLGANLSMRLAAILIAGFVAIQFLVFGAMILPGHQPPDHPYSFPPPRELAVMVDTIEQASPERQPLLISAFDGSLYTLTVEDKPPALPDTMDDIARATEQSYRSALPARQVLLSVRWALFPRVMRDKAWPSRLMPLLRLP